MDNSWFAATIITKCEIEGVSSFDEWTCSQDIFLIRASNREAAYEKAIGLGREQEHSYSNVNGQTVVWKFVGLENLEELPTKVLRDGAAVRGRTFHSNDPDALVVDREGLSVFYEEKEKGLSALEILQEGIETKLVCNRGKR